ncbi:sensor domain-containing diguanylate cyclase [Desulfocicer niacini]
MKSKSGSIMLTDGSSPNLTIQTARGLKKEIIETTRVRLGTGVAGKVATDGLPLYIKGIHKDRRTLVNPEDLTRKEIDNSFIIPLKLGHGAIGTINVNAMELSEPELAEKQQLVQNIITQFYKHLLNTEIKPSHHSPPSQLYMMNIFREYNTLRELKIVFDYIFQIITDVSGIQKKGVFFLKNKESKYFELVLGYGFDPGNYRNLYDEVMPSIQAKVSDSPHFMEIYNKADLSLVQTSSLIREEFIVVFPMISTGEKKASHGQLLLFNNEKPIIEKTQEILLKNICSRAGETIRTSHASQSFQELTYTDNLTGTYNYGLWWKRLNEEFTRIKREKRGIIALLLLDVDRFNSINLSHGYYVGDQMLRFIADKITANVRSNDIVGRIGGEKFGVILLQASKSSTLMIANRILGAVENISDEMRLNLDTPITLSGGISGFPLDADTPETLMEKSQTALVSAKIMGGNRIKLFEHMEE